MILDEMNKLGLTLPSGIERRINVEELESYYKFLSSNRERFFSRADQDRILERHLFESLIFTDYVSSVAGVSRETSVADAGTGPGLPGYLFACRSEIPGLTLIDSSARRLKLLDEHHQNRNRDNSPVRFKYGRLEELREEYQLITCRALIPFPGVVELVCGLQKIGGLFALSGANLPVQDPRIIEYLQMLGYVSRETITPEELKFLGTRNVYLFQKEKKTKKGYPRLWKHIKEAQQQWEK